MAADRVEADRVEVSCSRWLQPSRMATAWMKSTVCRVCRVEAAVAAVNATTPRRWVEAHRRLLDAGHRPKAANRTLDRVAARRAMRKTVREHAKQLHEVLDRWGPFFTALTRHLQATTVHDESNALGHFHLHVQYTSTSAERGFQQAVYCTKVST